MNPSLQSLPGRRATWLLACLVACMLPGCGGVGQDGTGAVPDTQATGVVTGFGSVIVDGVRFDISGADIATDGTSGRTQADLRVGMVVTVSGTLGANGTSGSATKVVYESLLRGALDSAPDSTGFLVLGQRVGIDSTTLFEGVESLADLNSGDPVQVSGFHEANGFRATWVRLEAGAVARHLTGFITAVNVNPNVVRLLGLDVNIGGAELVGVSPNSLANGQLVRVVLQAAPSNGTAVATRLVLLSDGLAGPLRRMLLHSLVRQWDPAAGTFLMNRQAVRIDGSTQFDGGTLTDIGNGARIGAIGTRGSDGVLVAERVQIYRPAIDGYVRGVVASVDVPARRFSVAVAPGVQVQVQARTLLSDRTLAGGGLALAELAPGNKVLALGWVNGAGIDAGLVQRLPLITLGSGIGGHAANIVGNTFTIFGTLVTTNNITTQFFDPQGQLQNQAQFFATLQADHVVRAEGALIGATLAATSVRRVP